MSGSSLILFTFYVETSRNCKNTENYVQFLRPN